MNYLFVDIAAVNRAPYSARWLNDYLFSRQLEGTASCAGIGITWNRVYKLSGQMIEAADVIFAMDSFIAREIKDKYPAVRRVIDIDIPDKFNMNKKDGILPDDTTPGELKEYMRSQEFGTRAMNMYLEAAIVPHLKV